MELEFGGASLTFSNKQGGPCTCSSSQKDSHLEQKKGCPAKNGLGVKNEDSTCTWHIAKGHGEERLIQSRENCRKVFRNYRGTLVQFPNLVFDNILLTDNVLSAKSGAVQRHRGVTWVHTLSYMESFTRAKSCSNVTIN